MVKSSKVFVRDCTVVGPLPLLILSPEAQWDSDCAPAAPGQPCKARYQYDQKVYRGTLGQRTGQGFYVVFDGYEDEEPQDTPLRDIEVFVPSAGSAGGWVGFEEGERMQADARSNPSIAKIGSFFVRMQRGKGQVAKRLCDASVQAVDLIFARFSDLHR